MPDNKKNEEKAMINKLTAADLTIRDVWDLVKSAIAAVFACLIAFVVPYFFLYGAGQSIDSSGNQDISKWIGIAVIALIIYLITSNLSNISGKLSLLFNSIAKITMNMSFFKKVILLSLFYLYYYGWYAYPDITFFISVLVLIPAEFTYERYKNIIQGKLDAIESGRVNVT
jgi:hypothetical protein